jgi:phosphate transport system protein
MLKELHKIFQRKGLMEQAVDASLEMLRYDWEMYREAVKSLRESDTAELAIDIGERDIQINKYEREVRKKVLTHLAVNDVSDLNIGLVLISIVIDIERIGDYTKNIVELAQNHPGRLVIDPWEPELKKIEDTISKNFGVLIHAVEKSDQTEAKNLLNELWQVTKQCDHFITTLLKDEQLQLKINDAVAISLYLRYLKRVASHLMNVATGIVNPFHKIGYRTI